MLLVHVQAGFGVFRTFTAGSYRPTAPFMTPSAAYGLLLNVAGIESRRDDAASAMTLLREGLPAVRLALGVLALPETQTVYQQLHNYPVRDNSPVRASGAERIPEAHGNKYNIQPARREFLSGLDAYIVLDGNEALEESVRDGLRLGSRHEPEGHRYGLPFLGDNNFMLSRLEEVKEPRAARWYVRAGDDVRMAQGPVRLTVWVDRAGMAGTVSGMFVLEGEARVSPPEGAWTRVPPE